MSMQNIHQRVEAGADGRSRSTTRGRILEAAREIATEKPLDTINLAEVARKAGVSWPTVRRHVGNKQHLRALLADERPELLEKNLNTRGRILAAASRVFAEHGYDGATLDMVAADAGVTKGAVYWHFASKGELFLALLEQDVEWMSKAIPEVLRSVGEIEDPIERWTKVLESEFEACVENPDWPRLFLEFSHSSRNPEVKKRLHELYDRTQKIIGDAVRQAQEAGHLSPELDPDAVGMLFRSLLNGLLLNWLVYREQVNTDALLPELARTLWHGLKPPKAESSSR
jgi:AcrR family transcriptional regulator